MKRLAIALLSFALTLALVVALFLALALLPGSPLPRHWNPLEPLRVTDPLTPLTRIKLTRALADPALCAAALNTPLLEPVRAGEHCGIDPRVAVSDLGGLPTTRLETACPTALRSAMWVQHGLRPAARTHLGTDLTAISHIGSYNCRQMRTANGTNGRWSSHARAASIDIIAVERADGGRLRLLGQWEGNSAEARFWRAARDSACDWFGLVLGPDFNRLHADHFHLQNRGWGLCR